MRVIQAAARLDQSVKMAANLGIELPSKGLRRRPRSATRSGDAFSVGMGPNAGNGSAPESPACLHSAGTASSISDALATRHSLRSRAERPISFVGSRPIMSACDSVTVTFRRPLRTFPSLSRRSSACRTFVACSLPSRPRPAA